MRAALIAAAAALVLAACQEAQNAGPAATEAANAAAPTLPLAFERKDEHGEVSLKIDPRLAAWPALHQRLYTEGKRELSDFLVRAAEAHAREPGPAYSREVRWRLTADTTRLVSLSQDWADYTGGAHGAYDSEPLLWNKSAEEPILQSALFRPDADYAALDALLCGAIRQAKIDRVGAEAADDFGANCPGWKDSRAILEPSTEAGKAGGVTFLYGPYVLGSYAEGPYEITIPQAQFRAALAPAWAGEFGGEPKPDQTPREPRDP